MKLFITLACVLFGSPLQKATSQWVPGTPQEVLWDLRDPAFNRSCILMAGTYDLLVPYRKESSEMDSAIVSASPNATITGSCGSIFSMEQSITLTWPVPSAPWTNETSNLTHTVTFTFSRNTTTGRTDGVEGFFALQRVKAVLQSNPAEFPEDVDPNKLYTLEAANMELLPTALTMSYYCSSTQDVPLGEGTLRLSHTQVEIFHSTPLQNDGVDFGPKSYCLADGLRMLITAIVLIGLLVGTGGVVIYLFKRKSVKDNYTTLD